MDAKLAVLSCLSSSEQESVVVDLETDVENSYVYTVCVSSKIQSRTLYVLDIQHPCTQPDVVTTCVSL